MTLARKLIKRPAVFVIHFQSPFQIVHVYQLLQSQYIFQKFDGPFNLMAIFLIFATFAIRFMKRLNDFMPYFQSSFISFYGHSQIFAIYDL